MARRAARVRGAAGCAAGAARRFDVAL